MPTYAGIECPVCHEAATEHVALMPLVDQSDPVNPKIIEPHTYAVCDDCHVAQYRERYGFSPSEAPSKAPPDPKPFVPKRKK